MIHYHGLPITPESAAVAVLAGRHAFASFAHPGQTGIALSVCQSVALDNGAFSAWRGGAPVADWGPYYEWTGELLRHPAVDWAVIPDVIEGSEAENDALVAEWPHGRHTGVPVWHLHESLGRLARLAADWPRVALGSSGDYSDPGSAPWWDRMSEAMQIVCSDGRPKVKLHGLRMLDPALFARVPLASADSCNVARNIGIDQAWRGAYQPPSKAVRAQVLASRIEATGSAERWLGRPIQQGLFDRPCATEAA